MRRWGIGLSIGLVLLVAGCGTPAGTDGDLLDDWPALAAPGVPVPAAGQCWTGATSAEKLTLADMKAADCATDHATETYYVGEFTGTLAQGSNAPGGADLADAYAACDDRSRGFIGGANWHDGRLVLRIFPPSQPQWAGGARFFRCDFVEVSDDNGTVVQRRSSLRESLNGSRPVEIGCVTVKIDSQGYIEDFVPIKCEMSHNGEYAGTFFSPDARPYPSDANARRALLQPGCKTIVAKYVGLTEAQFDANKQYTFAWSTASETRWSYGDRSARCYLMLEGTLTVSRSLRGNGNAPV